VTDVPPTRMLLFLQYAVIGGMTLFSSLPSISLPEPAPAAMEEPLAEVEDEVTDLEATVFAAELPVGVPASLAIDRLGIKADIVPMGVLPDGNLDAPGQPFQAGWWKDGARPGEQGTAVIDGHLTLRGKPALFGKLHTLTAGDAIQVTDDAGHTRTFLVYETQEYHVKDAPRERIFADATGTSLHLITCAGKWDRSIGHYDKRRIVYATLQE
jgi:hypothetical protein